MSFYLDECEGKGKYNSMLLSEDVTIGSLDADQYCKMTS